MAGSDADPASSAAGAIPAARSPHGDPIPSSLNSPTSMRGLMVGWKVRHAGRGRGPNRKAPRVRRIARRGHLSRVPDAPRERPYSMTPETQPSGGKFTGIPDGAAIFSELVTSGHFPMARRGHSDAEG